MPASKDRVEDVLADDTNSAPDAVAAATETHAASTPGPSHAFGVPNYRYLWVNTVTFFMVANALRFVYGWVVLDGLDLSESWQGFIVFVLGVPSFFLLAPAGVWADRLDPKRLLITTQMALAAVMVVTAILMGQGSGSLGLLIASALGAGAASALGQPVRSSLVPLVLPKRLLYGGIAMNAIAITLSLVLGAVTARAFGDWFGFDGAFYYLAALLLVGLMALSRLMSPGPASTGDTVGMREAMADGLRFVWRERGIRTLFILLTVSGLIMTPLMMVTIQAHIKEELGRTAGDAAPVLALLGVGIALSSVVIMRRGNMQNKGLFLMWAMFGGCTMLLLMGRATAYWQILVLALVLGMFGGFFINMNQGLIQNNTPSDIMGRVMSLYSLVQAGMAPLGALFLGLAAARFGTGITMSVGGAVGLACVAVVYLTGTSIREID